MKFSPLCIMKYCWSSFGFKNRFLWSKWKVIWFQGVGDLYTDPQIHTVLGTDYGDGNLGTKGMALFFHSHFCNDICHSLCLTEFDLSKAERQAAESGECFKMHWHQRWERWDSLLLGFYLHVDKTCPQKNKFTKERWNFIFFLMRCSSLVPTQLAFCKWHFMNSTHFPLAWLLLF